MVRRVMQELRVSERRACRVLGQARSTQRRSPRVRDDEDAFTRRIIELASCNGRHGYRRTTALLHREGWRVNHKRVERIWRREGLKVPRKQPKRGRLWLADGSCIRLRPTHRGHIWSYDFIFDRTRDGRAVKIMTVIDEYTRECLALRAERSMKSKEVLEVLDDLFIRRGIPEHVRSGNGPEVTAEVVRDWLDALEVRPLYIEPDGTWRIIAPTDVGPQPWCTGGEMVMWASSDEGRSWKKVKQLTSGSKRNHTYARRPVNAHPGFYAIWADGHGREPSESNLYFCDRAGNVFVLPREMSGDSVQPRGLNMDGRVKQTAASQ